MRKLKKLGALLLALALVLGLLPAGALASDGTGSVHVTVENTTYAAGAWTGTLADTWVEINDDSTLMTAIAAALDTVGAADAGAETGYITGVTNAAGSALTAGAAGGWDGWMVALNDWITSDSGSAYTVKAGTLKAGDEIRLMYSLNGGTDLGGDWSNNDKTVKAVAFSAGTLSAAFDKDTHNYTLTVPAGTKSVTVTPTASNKNFQVRTSVGTTEYPRTAAVPVSDGTVITVKCGDPAWPSMNGGTYGTADSVPAKTYTFTVACQPTVGSVHVTVENTTYDGGPWTGTLADTWVDIDGSSTALTAIAAALASAGASDTVTTSSYGSYISAVTDGTGKTLTAGAAGDLDGWMVSLNDWFPDQAISGYTAAAGTLKSGDELRLVYSMNGGADVGADYASTDKTLADLSFSVGTLDPDFDGAVDTYTLTVPDGTASLTVTPTAANKNLKTGVFVEGTEYGRTAAVPVADGTVLTVSCGSDTVYTVTVAYSDENTPPALAGDAAGTASAELGGSCRVYLSGLFQDDDGDDLTYSVSEDGGAAVSLGSVFAYDYKPSSAGTHTLAFTAGDGAAVSPVYTLTVTVTNPTLSALSFAADGAKVYMSPAFTSSGKSYTLTVPETLTGITANAAATGSDARILYNGGSGNKLSIGNSSRITVTATAGTGANSRSTVYTVTLVKADAVTFSIQTDPADAIVSVFDPDGARVEPGADGTYAGLAGLTYSYTVTKTGYAAKSGTVTPVNGGKVSVTLEKAASGLADVDAFWPSFRGNDANMAVTSAATPDNAGTASLLWSKKLGEGWSAAPSAQIIADGALVVLSGSTVNKLNLKTGEVMQSAALAGSIDWGYTPATCGAGMLFVPLDDGRIQALDAKTLKSLWIYTDSLGGQSISPITYADGYLYTGFWNSETATADFVCLSVTDEDATRTGEAKIASWTYAQAGGFYWAGAAAVGNNVIVGCDDGTSGDSGTGALLVFDRRTGAVVSSFPVTGDVRSSVAYDRTSGKIYFTTKAGYLYSADVDASTGAVSDLRGKSFGYASTSTPVAYKGRVYIGAGAGFGSGKLLALDADTLDVVYSLDMPGYPQCSLLLSTADESSTGKICIYSTYNYTPGGIAMVKVSPDASSAADAETTQLYGASGYENYCISSIICGTDGTLYYKNDSGYVLAVGVPDAQKVTALIDRIGTVTKDSGTGIQNARAAYDALTEEEKAQVANYGTLTAAEAAYAALSAKTPAEPVQPTQPATPAEPTAPVQPAGTGSGTGAGAKTGTPSSASAGSTGTGTKTAAGTKTEAGTKTDDAVKKVIAAIDALKGGAVSAADADRIAEAYQAYQALSDAQKKQVTNAGELDALTKAAGEINHRDDATGVSADGLDWNIRLVVTKLDAAGDKAAALQKKTDGKLLLVLDIHLENVLTGEEFEPEQPVTVSLPAPDADGYDGVVIVHEKTDGTLEYLDAAVKDGMLTFTAASFSTFAAEGYKGQSPLDAAQTSGRSANWILWACVAAALAVVIAVVAAKRKNRKSEDRAE